MHPRSAKAKGRKFQQLVRDILLEFAEGILEKDDIRSTSMGADGEDILLSPAARKIYPYSFECKHVEKLSIWSAIEQCEANAEHHTPAVVFRKNRKEAFIAIPFNHFMGLLDELQRFKTEDK